MNSNKTRSLLILGTAQFSENYGILGQTPLNSEVKAEHFLDRAEKLGFHAIDTASSYGGAEQIIGSTNTKLPVHTKIRQGPVSVKVITESLHRLRRNRIQILYLHDPRSPLRNGAQDLLEVSQFKGELYDFLGCSIYDPDVLDAAINLATVDVIQIPVNPLSNGLVNQLLSKEVVRPRIFARSVLAQGLLVSNLEDIPDSVRSLVPYIMSFREACKTIERSPLECALAWVRDNTCINGVVVGANSLEQLEQISLAFTSPPLSQSEREIIGAVVQPQPSQMDPRLW